MSEAVKKDVELESPESGVTEAKASSSSKNSAAQGGLRFSVVDQLAQEGDVVVQSEHDNVVALPNSTIPKRSSGGQEIDVLEAQVKLIALFSSEAKLLESQLNKIIKAIYAKNPKLKPELMMMKKILQNHANIEQILKKAKSVK